jgi:hypothetical protein
MKLPRRNFLHLAAGAAALSAVSHVARAQAYPARPVRWVDRSNDPVTEIVTGEVLRKRRSSRPAPGSAGPPYSPDCGLPRCLCPLC